MGYQKTLAPKTTSSNSSSCSGIRNNFEYPSSLKRRLKSGGMKVLIIGNLAIEDVTERPYTGIFNFKHHDDLLLEIGDIVLYYDAAKDKQWPGKLNPKWKGP
ncbi:17728_t:CDS:2 [Funneliformis geosporum]|uniref:17728_t:CDS:1 n=1 Tax=Funneliformis geosporum TaxID=1117311 RepID=A0A9W4T562_9GLOM|nr:17728_t:CDS:2 [Funneliformis geosporum]